MSIDHGKLLALSPEAIEAGWRATFSTDNPFCPCDLKTFAKAARWAERALAQPAEEVETFSEKNGVDLRGITVGQVLMQDQWNAVCAFVREQEQIIDSLKADAELKADAAQGAVARVAWRSDPDQGTYLVAEWLGPLPEPGELLYTHPQAAPAQVEGE